MKAASLVETFYGEGPYNVVALINTTFDRLPKGTVETLLRPDNKNKVQGVLTYHVLAGKYSPKGTRKATQSLAPTMSPS